MKIATCIIMLLLVSSLNAQELSKIYFINGVVITGKIMETVSDSTRIEVKKGTIITYKSSEISRTEPLQISKKGSVGLGVGVPYGGVFGLNLEAEVIKNANVSLGLGTTIFAGVGYNLGLKYYIRDVGNTWRPRISLHYGTNGVLVIEGSDEDLNESFSGLSIGIGQQWMFGDEKHHGLDLDVCYLASSGVFKRADELENDPNIVDLQKPNRVVIAIGYRYGF